MLPLTNKSISVKILFIIAIIFYATNLIVILLYDRWMYLDGANFYVNLLSGEHLWPYFNDDRHMRLFTNLINQSYTSFFIFLKIQNLILLRKLFGFGLLFNQLFFYYIAYRLCKRANNYKPMLIILLCYITCVMPSEIFFVNQSITTLSIFWVLFLYTILDIKFKTYDYILIFLTSALLLISHESIIFYSPFLMLASLYRYYYKNRKTIYLIMFLLGLILLSHGVNWIISIPVKHESGSYLNTLLYRLSPNELSYGLIRISAIGVSIFILLNIELHVRHTLYKVFIRSAIYLLLIFSIYIGISPFFDVNLLNPTKEFQSRALITFGAPFWMAVAIASTYYPTLLKNNRVIACCLTLLIASSLWQISSTIYWAKYIQQIQITLSSSNKTLLSSEDIIEAFSKAGQQKLSEFNCDWNWPVIGLALQNNYDVDRLIMPDSFIDYFIINKFDNAPPIVPFVNFTNRTPFNFDPLKIRCNDNPICFK